MNLNDEQTEYFVIGSHLTHVFVPAIGQVWPTAECLYLKMRYTCAYAVEDALDVCRFVGCQSFCEKQCLERRTNKQKCRAIREKYENSSAQVVSSSESHTESSGPETDAEDVLFQPSQALAGRYVEDTLNNQPQMETRARRKLNDNVSTPLSTREKAAVENPEEQMNQFAKQIQNAVVTDTSSQESDDSNTSKVARRSSFAGLDQMSENNTSKRHYKPDIVIRDATELGRDINCVCVCEHKRWNTQQDGILFSDETQSMLPITVRHALQTLLYAHICVKNQMGRLDKLIMCMSVKGCILYYSLEVDILMFTNEDDNQYLEPISKLLPEFASLMNMKIKMIHIGVSQYAMPNYDANQGDSYLVIPTPAILKGSIVPIQDKLMSIYKERSETEVKYEREENTVHSNLKVISFPRIIKALLNKHILTSAKCRQNPDSSSV